MPTFCRYEIKDPPPDDGPKNLRHPRMYELLRLMQDDKCLQCGAKANGLGGGCNKCRAIFRAWHEALDELQGVERGCLGTITTGDPCEKLEVDPGYVLGTVFMTVEHEGRGSVPPYTLLGIALPPQDAAKLAGEGRDLKHARVKLTRAYSKERGR